MSNSLDALKVTGAAELRGSVKIPLGLERQYFRQEDAAVVPILLTDFKVWDSGQPLSATPASDDLGLGAGTFGTGNLVISAGDVGGDGTTTRYARAIVTLPREYVAGETVTLNFAAGMVTTVADTTCTLDAEAYKVGRDSLVDGTDLVTTSAQSINSLSFADIAFTVTPTTLSPGDQLDVRVKIVCVDAATVAAVKPTIAAAELLVDIKG